MSYLYYKSLRRGDLFTRKEAHDRSRLAWAQTEALNDPDAEPYSVWPVSQDDNGYWRLEVLKPSALEEDEAAVLDRHPDNEDDYEDWEE